MLSPQDWPQLCQQLQLSETAQQVAEAIRASPPARRVQSRAGNVSVRYPSRKMGVTIQAESHRNELAGIYEKEHDPETLEYYDQPPSIKLVYPAKSGRRVGVWHTPDYFVIRRQGLGWEEWKLETELVRLAEATPHRYQRDPAGHWRCPPGETYAETLGFFYQVRSSAEIDWVFQRNVLFLEDYLRDDGTAVDPPLAQGLIAQVAAQPGLALQAWLRDAPGTAAGATCDAVYRLIATGQVYVDLHAAPLAEPERVRVFGDATLAQALASDPAPALPAAVGGAGCLEVAPGVGLDWDGRPWTIVNAGATQITLLATGGTLLALPQAAFEALVKQGRLTRRREAASPDLRPSVQERLAQASPADLAEANRRYALLRPRLAGQPDPQATTPARTLRHWHAAWRQAEATFGCGYVGLLPRRQQSGNRERKLPARTLAAMETFIAHDYETLKQKSRLAVYGALLRACETAAVTPPSYKTFAQAIAGRPRHAQTLKRQGPRAAYSQAPFYHELSLTTPRHGDRPFEIGHIDHTELDVELVCSRTGRNLGRPWATFLSDAFSRCLLAVYLAFDPPSYRAAMMVLRECVRRQARLPQIIVVDGGREFESLYFETLLARYECTKKTRPGAQPRFGSVCERLFGATNTRFIHNLLGNTQQACWTLGRLYARLCEWAYEVYPSLDHPALGQSPQQAFAAGLAQAGARPQRLVADDETWRMWTLPTTRKGSAKVMPSLGLKINGIYYWADAFRHPEIENTQVPLRFDPFDAGTAYTFVQGRWVGCISEHYAQLAGHSQRELMLATAELRRRQQRHGQQLAVTARKLADFLASVEAEEVLLQQRLRDAEAREILARDRAGAETSGERPPASAQPPQRTSPLASPDPEEVLNVYEDY
jgi:putative transposase